MQIFQILKGGMNFRERFQKNQVSSVVRSVGSEIGAYLFSFLFSGNLQREKNYDIDFEQNLVILAIVPCLVLW